MTVTTTATATTTEHRAWSHPVVRGRPRVTGGIAFRALSSAFAWGGVCGLWADGCAHRQGSGTALVLGRVLLASFTPPGGGWSCCGPTSSRARVLKFSEPPLRTRAYATTANLRPGVEATGRFRKFLPSACWPSHTGCSRATRNQPCEGFASPSSWRASPPGSAAVGATSRRLRRSCPQRRWSYRPLPEERTAPRWWRSHQLRSPWVLTRSRRPCPWRPLQSSWTPAMPCQCPCQLVVQTQCPCPCPCLCQSLWRCLWRCL